jgi:serine/threonine protein kinase
VSKYNFKADVWSAGIIGIMMLAGHPPFAGNGVYDLFKAIRAREIDFSDPVWELVSEEAKQFINWILVVDPDLRPSAAEALKHPWLNMD